MYFLQNHFDLRSDPNPDCRRNGNVCEIGTWISAQIRFDSRSHWNQQLSLEQKSASNGPRICESIWPSMRICSERRIWIWNPISGYGSGCENPNPDMEYHVQKTVNYPQKAEKHSNPKQKMEFAQRNFRTLQKVFGFAIRFDFRRRWHS